MHVFSIFTSRYYAQGLKALLQSRFRRIHPCHHVAFNTTAAVMCKVDPVIGKEGFTSFNLIPVVRGSTLAASGSSGTLDFPVMLLRSLVLFLLQKVRYKKHLGSQN